MAGLQRRSAAWLGPRRTAWWPARCRPLPAQALSGVGPGPCCLRLQAEGFSEAIIDRFFRPFLGGIFFDRRLGTTSRLFAFVMRMLATGELQIR